MWSAMDDKTPRDREIMLFDPRHGVLAGMWSPLRQHWISPTPSYVGFRAIEPVAWQDKPAEPDERALRAA